MKTLTLPAGAPYVRFDELAHLIAYAMYPLKGDDSPGDGLNYGSALVSLEVELQQAFESGALPVKDHLTYGPHVGHCRLEDTWVRVADLQVYLGDRLLVESDSTMPEKSEPAHTAKLELEVAASVGPAPLKALPAWSIKKPQRFQGYGKPLYDFLKAAHTAGKTRPNARDLLDSWKSNHPLDVVEVTDNGLKYLDAKGNTKPADLEAIRKAISRIARATPD